MHHDSAVQTSPPGLTLIIDDDLHDLSPCRPDSPDATPRERRKDDAVRRHLAQYGDQQTVNDELALGWDCGICFETAEEPCVTRCGHLYCQAHLHHWLAAHPSCPVCKTFCTPAADVVPIFSRGRTSPPYSLPSSPDSLGTPSLSPPTPMAPYSLPLTATAPVRVPTPPPPPSSASLSSLHLHRPIAIPPSASGDFDFSAFPLSPSCRTSPSPLRRTPSLPISPPSASAPPSAPAPSSSLSTPLTPLHAPRRPHPLAASYMIAHRLGLALRVLALAILLAVLLR